MATTYTLTIKFAPIGTPLSDGKTSLTGHMWYEVSGPNTDYGSFGWQMDDYKKNNDNFTTEDSGRYIPDNNHRITSISLGITEEQAKILTEDYPQRVQSGTAEGFNSNYNVLTNSCVDHVALGLRSIGLADKDFEGTIEFPASPANINSFLGQITKHLPEGTPIYVENLPEPRIELIDGDVENPKRIIEYYTGIYPKPELEMDLCPTLDKAEQASCPIVIDMNGDGIHYTKLAAGIKEAIYFDLDGNGFAEKTAWLNASDAFLVMDKNHNGKVDNIHEMFGNHTADKDGNKPYQHGYEALAAYDENKDGKIDAQDSVYAELAVWQDKNQDGISDEGEIISNLTIGFSKPCFVALAAINS